MNTRTYVKYGYFPINVVWKDGEPMIDNAFGLTEEQIESAAQAIWHAWTPDKSEKVTWNVIAEDARKTYRHMAIHAAPYLQMPWGMPTDAEIESININHGFQHKSEDGTARIYAPGRGAIVAKFVAERNAKRAPKPVDPRLQIVKEAIVRMRTMPTHEMAQSILDTLDAAVPK
jgi:hypothetical protein